MKKLIIFFFFFFVSGMGMSLAGERVTNEMIYQKLLEIEKRQTVLEVQFREFKDYVDKRFEQIDKRFKELRADMNARFEQVDKRFKELRSDMNARFEQVNHQFEQVNHQFEQVNHQFEQLYTFLWIITGIFTTLTLGVIGFAYWDRRTIIRKASEEAFKKVEDEGKWRVLLAALRELAREDARVARVLKDFGLL